MKNIKIVSSTLSTLAALATSSAFAQTVPSAANFEPFNAPKKIIELKGGLVRIKKLVEFQSLNRSSPASKPIFFQDGAQEADIQDIESRQSTTPVCVVKTIGKFGDTSNLDLFPGKVLRVDGVYPKMGGGVEITLLGNAVRPGQTAKNESDETLGLFQAHIICTLSTTESTEAILKVLGAEVLEFGTQKVSGHASAEIQFKNLPDNRRKLGTSAAPAQTYGLTVN